jgi:ribonuclease III
MSNTILRTMAELSKIQSALDLHFRNPALLELALVHSSYLNERPGQGLTSNERLEFLGDAVLGLFIADTLYRDFPGEDEGTLTRYRSILVRRETLSRLGSSLKLGDYLYLGRGEDSSGGRTKPANLSRALEALIAAVYLDQGSEAAGRFIQRLFAADLARLEALSAIADSKSQLQEIVQSRFQTTPAYSDTEIASQSGEKMFAAEVRVKGVVLGKGEGRTKKEAESRAARFALDKMENTLHPSEALLHLNPK